MFRYFHGRNKALPALLLGEAPIGTAILAVPGNRGADVEPFPQIVFINPSEMPEVRELKRPFPYLLTTAAANRMLISMKWIGAVAGARAGLRSDAGAGDRPYPSMGMSFRSASHLHQGRS